MVAPEPGSLQRLLDKAAAGETAGDGATLQVIEIVPAELDEKALWPGSGFYLKLSDGGGAAYAALPPAHGDLVLSDQLRLGQFVHVIALDPASPVPVIRGPTPLPGRHPIPPSPARPINKDITSLSKRYCSPARPIKEDCGSHSEKYCSQARPIKIDCGSLSKKYCSPAGPNKEDCGSLLKKNWSPARPVKEDCGSHPKSGSVSMGKLRRSEKKPIMSSPARPIKEDGSSISKNGSFSVMGRFRASQPVFSSPARPIKIDFEESNGEEKPTSVRPIRPNLVGSTGPKSKNNSEESPAQKVGPIKRDLMGPTRESRPIVGSDKLGVVTKEAEVQRDEAQRVALQALRDASAAETLVRVLKTFGQLSRSARAEAPGEAMEQFLSFHQEIAEAVSHMETIVATTAGQKEITADEQQQQQQQQQQESTSPTILMEISQNIGEIRPAKKKIAKLAGAFSTPSPPQCKATAAALEKTIKLAKKAQKGAGEWFMEFLEAALERDMQKKMMGMRESVCWGPQSVLVKVVNWVEMEQGDSSRGPTHPRVSQISRKLRIRVRNP